MTRNNDHEPVKPKLSEMKAGPMQMSKTVYGSKTTNGSQDIVRGHDKQAEVNV
jgi:hypothetical protein